MKLSAGFLALSLLASPALAGDFDWGRFYVGLGGGGGWGSARQHDDIPFDTGRFNVDGAIAGVVVGHDWQFGQQVIGLAADTSWTSIGGRIFFDNAKVNVCAFWCVIDLEWLTTVRARWGWAVNDHVMPYLTGGFAVGSLHGFEGYRKVGFTLGEGTEARPGFTIGAGVEGRINRNWTAGLEYLFVDLGSGYVFTDHIGGSTGDRREIVDFQTSIVRLSLNYRFGG